MIQKRVEFENQKSELLRGIIRVPDEKGKFPAVILCHTFHDNKDNDLMFDLWDAISRLRFICLRFDFAGHGESQGDFRDLTISQDVKDLRAAFEFIKKLEQADTDRIAIAGHSMGGIDSIIFSADNKEVSSLAVISARSDTREFIESYFSKREQEEWKKRGYIQLYNFGEISIDFLRDAEKHDILESVKKVKCPILILHGTDDTRVPFEDARELFNHAKEPKQLELIDGADHHFSNPRHRQELVEAVTEWLAKTLR